jgi:hypothetical protein
MIKKIAVLVTALAILPLAGLFAQDDGASGSSGSSKGNGFQIFSFDLIYGPEINVPDFDGDILVTPAFGLNFRFAEDFIVGFEINTGDGAFNGLNLKYDLSPVMRAVIYVGQNSGTAATTAAGFGLEYTIFSAKTALATDFRLGARYIFPADNPAEGKIGINLILGLGM